MKKRKWIRPACIVGVVLCLVAVLVFSLIVSAQDNDEYISKPEITENTVKESNEFATVTLTIPSGWEYETKTQSDSTDFCIAFWPKGQDNGKIEVWYYDSFGVCGTGLTEEKITLGNYEALKGTYDYNETWEFISLQGLIGNCVILNQNADIWLKEKNDQVMQILSTIVVAENDTSEK